MYQPGVFQHLVNRISRLNCPICFEDKRNNITLPCGHVSCRKCHREYVNFVFDPVCHMCRAPIYVFRYDYIFFGFPGGIFINFCM